jgi:peptidoglycan-N-acetylmuramic acid deacetylase
MKDKLMRIVMASGLLILCVLQFAIFSDASSLSNDLLRWGFRRGENGSQPTLDSKAKAVIESFEGITMGNSHEKNIYLTFDNGYEAGYTEKILDALENTDVKATFFITAHYLNSASDLVKRMIEEDHIVGNHTVNHKDLTTLSEKEIEKEVMDLHNAVYQKFGYEMKYFRPPKGEFSERVISVVNSLGYKTVMWSSAYDDWDKDKQNREEYGKNKIINNAHNGAVILLHATSKDNSQILESVINELKNKGYIFKNIDKFER